MKTESRYGVEYRILSDKVEIVTSIEGDDGNIHGGYYHFPLDAIHVDKYGVLYIRASLVMSLIVKAGQE